MPSKSKNKGNKFENDIVKVFNELHETEEFRRTPNSGAMMGQSNAAKFAGLSEGVRRTLSSDIITPDWFPFAVECKHYGDKPNYAAIIKEPDTTLDHWLGEAVYDAIQQELHPMLCFKTDRKGAHVAIPEYWVFTGLIPPTYYAMYNSEFVIMGLEHWKAVGPIYIQNYLDNGGFREELEQTRKEFYSYPSIQEYLQLLKK